MNIFDNTSAVTLPLVDQGGKYVGMLSKQQIFSKYRQVLQRFSDD